MRTRKLFLAFWAAILASLSVSTSVQASWCSRIFDSIKHSVFILPPDIYQVQSSLEYKVFRLEGLWRSDHFKTDPRAFLRHSKPVVLALDNAVDALENEQNEINFMIAASTIGNFTELVDQMFENSLMFFPDQTSWEDAFEQLGILNKLKIKLKIYHDTEVLHEALQDLESDLDNFYANELFNYKIMNLTARNNREPVLEQHAHDFMELLFQYVMRIKALKIKIFLNQNDPSYQVNQETISRISFHLFKMLIFERAPLSGLNENIERVENEFANLVAQLRVM